MPFPKALKHQLVIGTYIRRAIKAGVAMKVILDDIQKYDGAPSSMNGMYKTYREDIAAARAELGLEVGETIYDLAVEKKDTKMLELIARSKLGWSPTQTVVEADPEDVNEQTGAIDDLMTLLKLKKENLDTEEE